MKMHNMVSLQKQWRQFSTPQLEQMLRNETAKDIPNDDVVLLLLHILEERMEVSSENLSSKEQSAWNTYQSRQQARKQPARRSRWIAAAASLVVVVSILAAALPLQAQAETFWEMLSRWSSEFLSFFSQDENKNQYEEYVFKTDNPGLQQVYDAVVELGVTDPVVPMWIPDGYDLRECKTTARPSHTTIHARFCGPDSDCVFEINVYSDEISRDYFKNKEDPAVYEKEGTTYHIMQNMDLWIVVWINDNIECILTVDCPEDTLFDILGSIYHVGG